jgi:hypothetical protein
MNLSRPLLEVFAVIGLANAIVSFLVIRSHFYSVSQKLAQCAIVWLIPVLGPVGVWAFLRTQREWEKYDTRAYPEPSEKMVAVEINNSILDSFGENSDASGD